MKTLIATKTVGADRWRSQIPSETTGSLYVHLPFCKQKCPYCHFAVRSYDDHLKETYLSALKKEWAGRSHIFDHISTLYFGGGTPSILSKEDFSQVFSLFPTPQGEITIEANPEDITLDKMLFYKDLGINRVSIGIQSLNDQRLMAIGRGHSAKMAMESVEITHQAGFENITIDLMYDLPHQTIKEWEETLEKALTLPISHLSLYNLIIEEGSAYYKDRSNLKKLMPEDEMSLEMLSMAVAALESKGLERYEISAFAKKGFESAHNTGYWKGTPFLGVGPSAFSYHGGERFRNASHITKWANLIESGKEPMDFTECLPYPQNILELFTIRLRLLEGVSLGDFKTLPKETLGAIEKLVLGGYLKKEEGIVSLTSRGILFYDTVASELI